MDDLRVKYLEMIQSLIARMAANQFQARAWSVTLGSAVIGFAASKDGNLKAAILATLPACLFWRLDAYFLTLERKYRILFDRERDSAATPPSFSLDVESIHLGKNRKTRAAWLSPAVLPIHLPVIVLALIVTAYAFYPAPLAHLSCVCPGPPCITR